MEPWETIRFAPNQSLPEGWGVAFFHGRDKYRYFNPVDAFSEQWYDDRWSCRRAALLAYEGLSRIGYFDIYDEPEKEGHWFDPDDPWPDHWFDAEQAVMRRFWL